MTDEQASILSEPPEQEVVMLLPVALMAVQATWRILGIVARSCRPRLQACARSTAYL